MIPYAEGQLARSWRNLLKQPPGPKREAAEKKTKSWIQAIAGMLAGVIKVGSRRPVHNYPEWVTLEVLHGGFSSGGALAGGQDQPYERRLMKRFGCCKRETLNLHFLSEDGQQLLRQSLVSGAYRLRVPEEGAHLALVALLDAGREQEAAQVLAELLPFFPELRFYPELLEEAPSPIPPGTAHRYSAEALRQRLSSYRLPLEMRRMKESLREWRPFYEELLELTRETYLEGWPFQVIPEGWVQRAKKTIETLEERLASDCACHFPQRSDSNLRQMLTIVKQACTGSDKLSGRQVGLARVIVGDSEKRWGPLGSAERQAVLSSRNEAFRGAPPEEVVPVLLERLAQCCDTQGLSDPESFLQPVKDQPVPDVLAEKVRDALQATPQALLERRLVGSAEVLGGLIPQLSSRVVRRGCPDPTVGLLLERLYKAFRDRRSLLLLNLESQVSFQELPWVSALPQEPETSAQESLALAAEMVGLAWRFFPQTALPNTFVRELNTLLNRGNTEGRLLEELAADIFVGNFSPKFLAATKRTAELAEGTLYARYYQLPELALVEQLETGKELLKLCRERARERLVGGNRVVQNGILLEEQQILNGANLFALKAALEPDFSAFESARKVLQWTKQELEMDCPGYYSRLLRHKRVAYGWRQLLFFLSNCPSQEVEQLLVDFDHEPLQDMVAELLACLQGSPPHSGLRGWVAGDHLLLA